MRSRAWGGCRGWATNGKTLPTRDTVSGRYAYVIAHRWETTPIQIVAVVHGARQLEAFFQLRIQ